MMMKPQREGDLISMSISRLYVATLFLMMAIFLISCGKKQEEYSSPAPPTPSSGLSGPGVPSDVPIISSNAPLVVPDSVKGKWRAVKLTVEDKKGQGAKEYTVNLHSDFTIPDSKLVVKVGEFLPDLKIQGTMFTSESNDLNNPAVHVIVLEDNKEIFNGWLFSHFPMIHPFKHDRYRITLKEAIPAA
jgi:Uncharacterized protein conserved in bacteria (DUF2155)